MNSEQRYNRRINFLEKFLGKVVTFTTLKSAHNIWDNKHTYLGIVAELDTGYGIVLGIRCKGICHIMCDDFVDAGWINLKSIRLASPTETIIFKIENNL